MRVRALPLYSEIISPPDGHNAWGRSAKAGGHMAEGGGFLAPGSGEGVHRRVHLLHAAALEQRAVRGFLLLPKNFVAFVTSPFPITILYSAT